ncbi:dihydroorotate dehydrogenase electron transfer subunit [Kitasatospora viridis]|uniref:Dihydroorotate dehydrogenase electron transfer subunit n=1 Tax=Kitasatospora viridis TaxID=281105 RepID=A0A561UAE4_9ACTN|nr:dihydroorotate dehydrogenase electron transfer subunit [Kitasatospora viridis]TWF96336.1 dihydroorotate dehydrogenase electron transfer subunit [Kitasatospora viridis]
MANPLQLRAEVLADHPEGAYRRLVLRAPGVPRRVRPGHLAALAVGGAGAPRLLRRAHPVHRADPAAGTVELVLPADDPAVAEKATELDLIAPLGTPFPLPDGPAAALLVGEQAAAGPLLELGAELLRRGCRIGFVLGAPSADRLYGVERAQVLTPDVLVLTEDGSAGLAGRVTDPPAGGGGPHSPSVLAQAVEAIGATVLYAAGGRRTLAAAARTAAERSVRCHTAVPQAAVCATGSCLSCVLPVVGADGRVRFARGCADGPVFDGTKVRWEQIGTVPADLDGAGAAR